MAHAADDEGTIDSTPEGGWSQDRMPLVLILVVEGGGSACSIDGAASDGKKWHFQPRCIHRNFSKLHARRASEDEEMKIS